MVPRELVEYSRASVDAPPLLCDSFPRLVVPVSLVYTVSNTLHRLDWNPQVYRFVEDPMVL